MNVLVQNGIKKLTEMTTRTFLLANQGVYTGTRTIGQNKIVALKDNVDRLRKSINESENMNCTYKEIENLFINNISIAYKEFMVQRQNFNGEVFFITILNRDTNSGINISVLASEMKKHPQRAIVEIRGAPRKTPKIKNTQWVHEREKIVASPDANDYVLYDENGRLYEGSSSNFHVVKDNKIYTAPTEVLDGITQKIVNGVCANHTIPVIFEYPIIKDNNAWTGAFLTSTTRGILPIERIRFPEHNLPDRVFSDLTFIEQLSKEVESSFHQVAESIQ